MGKVKGLLMTAEAVLQECLNDRGMTNKQALAFIKKELGQMAHDHAKDVLEDWNSIYNHNNERKVSDGNS